MNNYIFTDLACEISDHYYAKEEKLSEDIRRIVSSDTDRDRYVTFFTPHIWMLNDAEYSILRNAVSDELCRFLGRVAPKDLGRRILVVGLGNPHITSDSLGPRVVDKIYVTERGDKETVRVMAIAPDVAGNTGIETLDAVRAYVGALRPDALVVIDSLRSRGYERLASTVQLSDGGIIPGSGVGRGRSPLTEETLGVGVISIGIPTVISVSTLIHQTLSECGASPNDALLSEILDNGLDFFVTPKESDILVRSAALLLSDAINSALCRL